MRRGRRRRRGEEKEEEKNVDGKTFVFLHISSYGAVLDDTWGALGASWGALESFGVDLERSLGFPGGSLGVPWAPQGSPGRFLGVPRVSERSLGGP